MKFVPRTTHLGNEGVGLPRAESESQMSHSLFRARGERKVAEHWGAKTHAVPKSASG